MRPIDADELMTEIMDSDLDHLQRDDWKEIIQIVQDAPTIQTQWIPVTERLPDEAYGCLVTVWDTNPVTMDEFENILPYFVGWDGEQWNDGDGEQCPFEVIAWIAIEVYFDGLPIVVHYDMIAMIHRLPSAQPLVKCVPKVTMTDEQVREAFKNAKLDFIAAPQPTQLEIDMAYMRGKVDGIRQCIEKLRKLRESINV